MSHSQTLLPIVPTDGAGPGREQLVGIGGDFFEAMGIQAISGRLPTSDELHSSARVAVVSERVARAFWPGRSPIGQDLDRTGRPARRSSGP